jgi:polyisoprenoid-binding protein YceI
MATVPHDLSTEKGIRRVPTGTWVVDPVHTSISFRIRHMGIATVRGKFNDFDGRIDAAPDYHDSSASGHATAASIDTGNDDRDTHLRSADFFDVENYPDINFVTTHIEHVEKGTFNVTCELTMHGVTRAVTVEVTVQGAEVDPWGQNRVGVEIQGEISRKDFGLNFNHVLDSGAVMLGDAVKLDIDASLVQQQDES